MENILQYIPQVISAILLAALILTLPVAFQKPEKQALLPQFLPDSSQ